MGKMNNRKWTERKNVIESSYFLPELDNVLEYCCPWVALVEWTDVLLVVLIMIMGGSIDDGLLTLVATGRTGLVWLVLLVENAVIKLPVVCDGNIVVIVSVVIIELVLFDCEDINKDDKVRFEICWLDVIPMVDWPWTLNWLII